MDVSRRVSLPWHVLVSILFLHWIISVSATAAQDVEKAPVATDTTDRTYTTYSTCTTYAAQDAQDVEQGPDAKSEPGNVKTAGQGEEDYYELLKLFVDTLDQVERNYVKDISRRELMEAAIEGILSKLDQHSSYIPPQELDRFKTGVESEFGGIGIQIETERGKLIITSPLVGTPAYRAGLMAGDVITHIEGTSAEGITLSEAVKRLQGKVGTSVQITVRHAHDSSTETVSLQRELIHVPTVLGHRRKDDDTWDYMYEREKKIGYIYITTFARHTTDELRAALKELQSQGMRGLILDLRFNPGGLLSSAIQVSDMFVSEGLIVGTQGRNAPSHQWHAHKHGTFEGFLMAVLVNHFSASASEIVSACLQDHARAVVVGERTWGKGSVQNIIELEDGRSALKLTTAGYRRPNGKNIDRDESAGEAGDWGVSPNDGFEVKLSDAETGQWIRSRRARDILPAKQGDQKPDDKGFVDPQLQKALNYLAERLSQETAGKEVAKAGDEAAKKE